MAPDLKHARHLIKNFGGPGLVRYIGGGANGRVFETNDGRFLKVVANYAPQEWKSLLRLQGTRIVPRFNKKNLITIPLNQEQYKNTVKRIFGFKTVGRALTIFTMGRVGDGRAMTLYDYFKKFPNKTLRHGAQNRIFNIISEMHVRGISHGNLHGGNILVTSDPSGRLTGMWVIDFGRSREFPVGLTESQFYKLKTPNKVQKTGVLNRSGRVAMIPLYRGSRSNVNMARGHYNKNYIRPRENIIRNRRMSIAKNLELLKSPRKVSSVRRSKSLSHFFDRTKYFV